MRTLSASHKRRAVTGAAAVGLVLGAFFLMQVPEPQPSASTAAPALVSSYKAATTTVFWAGEGETEDNNYISNAMSAWDQQWTESYGGVDDPIDRCGYLPCSFTPKQNPFYVALPYSDLDSRGERKTSAAQIPWASAVANERSLVENRWVEVGFAGRTCYAQVKDVGPFESDDFAYVFGESAIPKNTFGQGAGLDVSPAVRDCLRMGDVGYTIWRFVDEAMVPAGPWRAIEG